MTNNVFITGTSSGLGRGFAQTYLEQGAHVYGLSRRPANIDSAHFHAACADLGQLDSIDTVLDALLADADPDVAILSAGMLGDFKTMPELRLDELRRAMDINVWANKLILDWFARHKAPRQIVLISSGASVKGNKGWGSYALSKATLNMLAQLYAHDLPNSHLLALAPGLIHTAMQDQINSDVDVNEFPSVERLKQARGTADMPGPRAVADTIAAALPRLSREYPSGAFADIRHI